MNQQTKNPQKSQSPSNWAFPQNQL